MIRHDFLLEIRTEEIPAAAMVAARLDLARLMKQALDEEGLAAEEAQSLGTPRRLILILRGLPDRQEDRFSEILGPAANAAYDTEGKATRVAEGFAKAQKVALSELVVVKSPRGPAVAVRRAVPGRRAVEILAEKTPRVVSLMTFPKTMRWGKGDRAFVRPVRGVLALYDGQVVPLEIFGVSSTGSTVGHAILSEGEIPVRGPENFVESLRSHGVEPDPEARRVAILEAARREAAAVGGSIESDTDLAATLADLVEWPGIVRGQFDEEFLYLPEEITTTAMRTHQKYMPVRGQGGLLPHFIAVMNNVEDRKGLIAKGNEWVLNARLADARFFYEEDLRESLESRLPKLESLSFQDLLGNYRQKTARLEELAGTIAQAVGRPEAAPAARAAARLSKVDLTTHMVKEFTDLQGVVGGIYARREGQPDSVWKAIYDHYRPNSGSDDPPREAAGAIVSLADRFDTLAGLFRIGLLPTGSRDPYGLRRVALGAVAIILAQRWQLGWSPVLGKALSLYPSDLPGLAPEEALAKLSEFFGERLRNVLERSGHAHDEISAVLKVGLWDFADAADRAKALAQARREMDLRSLVLSFKRLRNIAGEEHPPDPSPALYREEAERALAADFLQARRTIGQLVARRRYLEALETIASISPSLERFFVEVLVNCPEEDVRRNRLALLASIQKEFSLLADFSEIVVEK